MGHQSDTELIGKVDKWYGVRATLKSCSITKNTTVKTKQWEVGVRAWTTTRNSPQGTETVLPGRILTGQGHDSIKENNESNKEYINLSVLFVKFYKIHDELASETLMHCWAVVLTCLPVSGELVV